MMPLVVFTFIYLPKYSAKEMSFFSTDPWGVKVERVEMCVHTIFSSDCNNSLFFFRFSAYI